MLLMGDINQERFEVLRGQLLAHEIILRALLRASPELKGQLSKYIATARKDGLFDELTDDERLTLLDSANSLLR
jgi:hypothetical protein